MNKDHNPFDESAIAYDQWFEEHENAYKSELLAIKQFIPEGKYGLEVGVGTGRFAAKFGIQKAVEPAPRMAEIAKSRGVDVIAGVAENLPFEDKQFDFVLMVAVDCFVDDIEMAYREIARVLKPGGKLIIGLLDKDGAVAQRYETKKAPDNIYWYAQFYTTEETITMLKKTGFGGFKFCQTLTILDPLTVEIPTEGYGKGSFVVISAKKI